MYDKRKNAALEIEKYSLFLSSNLVLKRIIFEFEKWMKNTNLIEQKKL